MQTTLSSGWSCLPYDAVAAEMVTVKVLPWPNWLMTSISPPRALARRREIARPMPVPPKRRVVELSAWVNGWNSPPSVSGEMPMPVSEMANCTRPEPGAGSRLRTDTRTPPCSVNLTALPSRFSRICRSLAGSVWIVGRDRAIVVDFER